MSDIEEYPVGREVIVDGHQWTVTGCPEHDRDILVLHRKDGLRSLYRTVRQSLSGVIWA